MSELPRFVDSPEPTSENTHATQQFNQITGIHAPFGEPSPLSVTSESAVDAVPDHLSPAPESASSRDEGAPLVVGDTVNMQALSLRLGSIKEAAATARAAVAGDIDAAAKAEAYRLHATGNGATAPRPVPGKYTAATPQRERPERPTHVEATTGGQQEQDVLGSVMELLENGTIQPRDLAELTALLDQDKVFTGRLEYLNVLKEGLTHDGLAALKDLLNDIGDEESEPIQEADGDNEEGHEANANIAREAIATYTDAVTEATMEYGAYMNSVRDGDTTKRQLELEVERPDGTYNLGLHDGAYVHVSRTVTNPSGQLVVQQQGMYVDSGGERIRVDAHGFSDMPAEVQRQITSGEIVLDDPTLSPDEVKGVAALINEGTPRHVSFEDLRSGHAAAKASETTVAEAQKAATEFQEYAGDYLSEGLLMRYGADTDSLFRAISDNINGGQRYSRTILEHSASDPKAITGSFSVTVAWPGRTVGKNDLGVTIVHSRNFAADGTSARSAEDVARQQLTNLRYTTHKDNVLVRTNEEIVIENGQTTVVGTQETICAPQDARYVRNFLRQVGFSEDS